MAQSSNIEWTQTTWNPVVGCTKVSAGCKNCYAERMAKRLASVSRAARTVGQNPGRTGNYEHVVNARGKWNSHVFLDHEAADEPRSWRLPRVIFVNSMSDLFHEEVPLAFVQRVFATMNACPQHTFQILTKRPQIAAEFAPQLKWTPNIWMGTSVEDSLVAHRIKDLRRIKAHVRFLSIEPLLGPIPHLSLEGIHWVIVGGESGPGSREVKPEWVTQIRDRCVAQGVPFFFKQWGGVNKKRAGRVLEGHLWNQMPIPRDSPRRKISGE
jgi:protein gp37